MVNQTPKAPAGKVLVYSSFITLKNGKRLYAANYGKKAWVFYAKKK